MLAFSACSSAPAGSTAADGGPRKKAAVSAEAPEERDQAVFDAIEASAEWRQPSCRWLQHGAWVVAYPSESKLYLAARDLGFIELEEVGQANRHGWPEPAYKIALTESGQEEASDCPETSQHDVWGIPVSRRKLLAVSYVKEGVYPSGLTHFEAVFEWQPTEVGERVKHDLTGKQAVQEGKSSMLVNMRKERTGWQVDRLLPRVDPPTR